MPFFCYRQNSYNIQTKALLKTFVWMFISLRLSRIFIFLPFLIINLNSYSQTNTLVDSLLNELKKPKEDTNKVNILTDLFYQFLYSEPQIALKYATQALKLSEDLRWEKGIMDSEHALGNYYFAINDYQNALTFWFKTLRRREILKDKQGISSSLCNIGSVFMEQGDYPKALDYYFEALKISKEFGNKIKIAMIISNIGSVYSSQGDYPKALDYYNEALKIRNELGDKTGIASTMNNIGFIYKKQGNYHEALKNYFISLKLYKEINNKLAIATLHANIGQVLLKQQKAGEAIQWFQKGLKIAIEIRSLSNIKNNYEGLEQGYYSRGNYKKAYEYNKLYIIYRDSLFNEENTKKILQDQMQYNFDKKQEAAKFEQKKKNIIVQKEKQKQNQILIFVSCFLLLLIVFTGFVFRNLQINKKQNKIIEEKNKDITDSINYAQKIQSSILPNDDEFKMAFPDSFVLYKPKDIVSGDFYWISINPIGFSAIDKVGKDWKVTNSLVAAVDCTGHGVPGSLMSMLGNSLLNKIVDTNKISKPSEILGALRTEIINSLKQHGENENKDGMDIALCAVYPDRIEFSGANNPIYIIRKNGSLEKIKGDKMPIGYSGEELKPYTNHEINMEKGDSFYIFTDGYADQFGGENQKKFKYKQLEELLVAVYSKPLEAQKIMLNESIERWKGLNEQTDDILIIGVRF